MKKSTDTSPVPATASRPRVLVGTVVSVKMKDTVVVEVKRFVKHPKYRKFYSESKKYHVHDTGNAHAIGETVRIVECKPISKTKRFRVVDNQSVVSA